MKKSGLDSDEASGDLKETCREGAFPHLCFLLPPFPFFLSSTQDSCFLSFLLSPPSQYPFLFFSLSSMPVPSSLCLSQTNPPSSSLPQANIFFSLPFKPLPYFLPPPPPFFVLPLNLAVAAMPGSCSKPGATPSILHCHNWAQSCSTGAEVAAELSKVSFVWEGFKPTKVFLNSYNHHKSEVI